MRAYFVTDTGKSREENQDYVLCEESAVGSLPNLFLVADGMGGHRSGDYASRFCVETIRQIVEESHLPSAVMVLQEAIKIANTRLREQAEKDVRRKGMGTTMVAATLLGKSLYVANVGDSRLYLYSEGRLRQITEDHSLVEAMVRNGELGRVEAKYHPNKNIITRALGGHPEVIADFFEVTVGEDDRILMCTDGLSNMVEDEEMEELLRDYQDDPELAARELVQRANDNGGRDNITVIMIKP